MKIRQQQPNKQKKKLQLHINRNSLKEIYRHFEQNKEMMLVVAAVLSSSSFRLDVKSINFYYARNFKN